MVNNLLTLDLKRAQEEDLWVGPLDYFMWNDFSTTLAKWLSELPNQSARVVLFSQYGLKESNMELKGGQILVKDHRPSESRGWAVNQVMDFIFGGSPLPCAFRIISPDKINVEKLALGCFYQLIDEHYVNQSGEYTYEEMDSNDDVKIKLLRETYPELLGMQSRQDDDA